MSCHRGPAAHMAMCIAPSSSHEDRDVFPPLPPAILVEQGIMNGPQFGGENLWKLSDMPRAGFAPFPFEPPRT
jgi:hypothetical protein